MWYRKLSDFESMFSGHWRAYCELAGFDDSENSFNLSFIRWLWEKKGLGASHNGWADAVGRYAAKEHTDPEEVFLEFVKEFLATWNTSPQVETEGTG